MADFQHILRVLNTNVDGREKVVIALTAIRGIGRRISTLICKKADIDIDKRAGELTADEIGKVTTRSASVCVPAHRHSRKLFRQQPRAFTFSSHKSSGECCESSGSGG